MNGMRRAGVLLFVATLLVVGRPAGSQGAEAAGAPEWKEPGQYSVEMVIRRGAEVVTMKRFLDSGLTRTEIAVEGQNIVMIERPDRGVLYMVMPMMSPGQQKAYLERKIPKVEKPEAGPPPAVSMRHLGSEAVGGRPCDKYEIAYEGRTALYWADRETKAPVRMQDGEQSVDWQNYRPGPQPAALFEPPPGYERVVMPDMSAMMGQMAGPAALGMAKGVGAQAAGQAVAAAGAAVGGPVGAIVGQMVGEQVAGWLMNKGQNAMMPGMAPGMPPPGRP